MESKKGTSTAAPLCCLLLLIMFILPSEERTTEQLGSPLVRRYCGQPSHLYGSSHDCLPGLCEQACRDEGFNLWDCINVECYCFKFCGGSTAAAAASSP